MPSSRFPKIGEWLLWLAGAGAAAVLLWLFFAVANRPAPPATEQNIVLITATPTLQATPTAENVFQFIVTPTPGGPLFEQPTLPPPPPVIYPSARGRSGFLYGGQVLDLNAVDKMHWAGMGWVKWQIREGDTDALDKIQLGHGEGFKVLLTVIGSPGSVEDAGYHEQFAGYVAGLAAGGADAIEIWNEPNLSRDWPTGKISPITYIKLLKASYQAIKAANPNTLVISAANAATLVSKSLKTPHFWSETDFTTEFVQYGGLLYTDCVGVHYNIGISAPLNTDNSLTGDAAFWFLPRILKYYSDLTKNTRPVCITELGYLTDDGLDPLETVAPDFAWAKDTTLQDQAEWHAVAAQIGLSNPFVEMIVVWNVDFYAYGADPHAGYAIVRKDGGCPACDALHTLGLGN